MGRAPDRDIVREVMFGGPLPADESVRQELRTEVGRRMRVLTGLVGVLSVSMILVLGALGWRRSQDWPLAIIVGNVVVGLVSISIALTRLTVASRRLDPRRH